MKHLRRLLVTSIVLINILTGVAGVRSPRSGSRSSVIFGAKSLRLSDHLGIGLLLMCAALAPLKKNMIVERVIHAFRLPGSKERHGFRPVLEKVMQWFLG